MTDGPTWDGRDLTVLAESFGGINGRVAPAVSQAIKDGGEAIAKRAKELAPKGQTGKLRRSIKSTFTEGKGGTEAQAEIGPTVFYGRFVEHGTAKMSARPYLAPAADSLTEQISEQVAEAAGKALG